VLPNPGIGGRKQRRDRRYADELAVVKLRRRPVHRVALFALDGTDHTSHCEQASMTRCYIIWRNNHAYDEQLCRIYAPTIFR
jgi:hypothetical protein